MKRRFLWAAAVFCAVSGLAFGQFEPNEVDYLLRRAEEYRIQQDFENAFDIYNTVLAREPANIKALNGRGVCHQKRGDYLKARSDFQHAYLLNPTNAESQHNLESITNRMKAQAGLPESVEAYNDAEGYPPPDSAAAGVDGGGAVFENYQPVPPGGVPSIYERNVQRESPQGSLSLYDRALSAANAETLPQRQTPQTAQSMPQTAPERALPPQGSLSLYDRALSAANAEALPQRQTPPTAQSMPQSAPPFAQPMPFAQTATERTPSPQSAGSPSPYVPSAQGGFAPAPVNPALQQQASHAAQTGLRSLRLDAAPNTPGGAALVSQGYYERAVLAYTDILTRSPSLAVAYNNRGVAYARLGEWQRALEDFNQALRLNPYYYDAQSNRQELKNIPRR